jgi:ketosteroid isomerase-like protein
MSQENVEIVRRYFDAVKRGLDAHWDNPRSVAAAMSTDELPPAQREVLGFTHVDVEWRNAFGLNFKGQLDFAKGGDQLLEATNDFWIEVQEVTDLEGERVLALVKSAMKGKDSEIEVSQTVFSLMTVREGLIVRAEEYLHRQEALEAAGPRAAGVACPTQCR